MGNTFLTPTEIAAEALLSLENAMGMAETVYQDYKAEFQKKGDTVTIRKPASFTAIEFDGDLTGEYQDITESSTTVVLDTILDVSFLVGSKELTLDIVSFRKQILDPAMQAISQALDYKLTGLYADVANHVAYDATSEATKLANLANSMAFLNAEKAPLSPRYGMIDETTHAGLVVVPSFLNAEKSGTTETLRESSLGKLFGAQWFMNQNVRAHTWTAYADLAGAIDFGSGSTGAVVVGTTTVHMDALGSLVITKGTVFTVAGDTTKYVVTADVTIGSNECDVAFYPASKVAWDENAVVTFLTQSVAENLIYHRNAFALVFRPLEPPMGGAKGVQVNWRGLPLRMTYDYNMNTKANICSIDLLCGVKTLTPELACRLIKHT